MTMHAFNSTAQFSASLSMAAGDSLVIGQDGFVYGQVDLFTGLNSGPRSIVVAGTAATAGFAVTLGAFQNEAYGTRFIVTDTGHVHGYAGLLYTGSNLLLDNSGTISGDDTAIFLDGGTAFDGNRIVNSGTIVGGYGIASTLWRTSATVIVNTGVIEGNLGAAIELRDAIEVGDSILNAGRIVGDVFMGGGADLYDGRGGQLNGTVHGDSGNDLFRPGASEEAFDGGMGTDTLDFRSGGGAVELALDGSWDSTGWAEGDTYTGFERVIGTTQADRIGGNSAANVLNGGAGADQLFGRAGNDTLIGGGGIDILSGGSGNDSFQFNRLAECGDSLTDFSSAVAGDNDRFLISTDFGGGLAAGALAAGLFVSRADNLAQDANDRFIFRTADRTLWFDADGTGTGAGVLVATLQAGATMTAADIVIF